MGGKKIVALLMLIVLECYSQSNDYEKYKKDDHSFMFNKSLRWLIQATPEELKFVINQNKFKRFSLTKEHTIYVLYEAKERRNIDSTQLNGIVQSILTYRKRFEKKKINPPRVDLFQWNEYLERSSTECPKV
ncbi:MAG: hypothetical protein RLZ91_1346 [Bacteroidota bacterium]